MKALPTLSGASFMSGKMPGLVLSLFLSVGLDAVCPPAHGDRPGIKRSNTKSSLSGSPLQGDKGTKGPLHLRLGVDKS